MPRSPPQFVRLPNGARYSYGANGYDVLNAVVANGERGPAGEHLATTEACDLLLYDRVYPPFGLFAPPNRSSVSSASDCW
jgi:hypothetical protein